MDADRISRSASCMSSTSEDLPMKEIFSCPYSDCDYTSTWKENVGPGCHESGHNPTKQLDISCQVCPQTLGSLVSFFDHMSSQHPDKLFCPCCHFLGQDLTEYKAHVLVHGALKPSRPNTTQGIRKFCCGICFKSFSRASGLRRHSKRIHCLGNSRTSSVQNQVEIPEGSQESFQIPQVPKPVAAGDTSAMSSVDEEYFIEQVNIEGETFFSCTICGHKARKRGNLKAHSHVHTDHRPFGCTIEGCKYRARLLKNLIRHSRNVHHINSLPEEEIAETQGGNLGLGMDLDNQVQIHASSSNFSLAFACMLCEFIGDSELAALEHAQQHKK